MLEASTDEELRITQRAVRIKDFITSMLLSEEIENSADVIFNAYCSMRIAYCFVLWMLQVY